MNMFLVVLFRWLHVFSAAIVIGGVFVMGIVLPAGLILIDPEQAKILFLKCRRIFKLTVHPCILFLLVSGAYNTWSNWDAYKFTSPWSHVLDVHVTLGVLVIGVALFVLAGKEAPKSQKTWMAVSLLLLALAVLAAGLTKYIREHPLNFGRSDIWKASVKAWM